MRPIYFNRALRVSKVISMCSKRAFYTFNHLWRCSGKGIPSCGQNGNQLKIVGGKAIEELYRENFAEVRPSKHHSGKGEVCFGLREKVGPHDKGDIDDGHVLEARILVHNGPNDAKVDVCCRQLSGEGQYKLRPAVENVLPAQRAVCRGSVNTHELMRGRQPTNGCLPAISNRLSITV